MEGIANVKSSTSVSLGTGGGSQAYEIEVEIGMFGPLPARVGRDDDGTVLIVDLVTGSYGVGSSWADAVQALTGAIHRHYRFLSREGPGRLSSRLADQLEDLDRRAAKNGTTDVHLSTPDGLPRLSLAA